MKKSLSGHYQWTGKPKVSHDSLESAERHQLELAAKDGETIEIYRCYTCNSWHVGHPPTRVKWFERSLVAREEMLVGRLIGVLRGTYKAPPQKPHLKDK